jgi:hypothetical protein
MSKSSPKLLVNYRKRILNGNVLLLLHKDLNQLYLLLVCSLSILQHSYIVSLVGQDIKEFPVKKPLVIVDTNGAGDSFVGGTRSYE